jgi:hypothetical protein
MTGYRLFEAFGLELEYMIVNRDTLAVMPAADSVFLRETGWPCCSFDNGEVSWSNEMVLHVIELKTTRPVKSLACLPDLFSESVQKINGLLKTDNGMLLPTASHPLMDPARESRLWPHENTAIYKQYDRIFDCSGHGWSNLQSTHINLPFTGDGEFGILHAAVRFLLPLIPGLCASSPVIEGVPTGILDNRMRFYMDNQKNIPVIAGNTIPEPVYTKSGYERRIFKRIERAIGPHDPERILDKHFLNSRGAIARFDRNSIEIRVMDIQESPLADMACSALIIGVLKKLCLDERGVLSRIGRFPTARLKRILKATIETGEKTLITDKGYTDLLGLGRVELTAAGCWQRLTGQVMEEIPPELKPPLETILNRGTLSSALLRDLGPEPDQGKIHKVWNKTARCLSGNTLYG